VRQWTAINVAWVGLACCLALTSVAAGQTLERVAAAKAIRVGFIADHAPFASRPADGPPAGYSIDVCNKVIEKIAADLGPIRTDYIETTLADAFNAIAEDRLDLLCSAITITLTRRELVDFSEPIFVTGASAILRKDSPRDLRELFLGERTISPPRSLALRPFARSRIGVRAGTTTEAVLERAVTAGKYTTDIVHFDAHADALKALEDREIDAYFADLALLAGMLNEARNASAIVLADRRLTNEFYGIAMKRGDSDLRLLVDRVLSELFAATEFPALLTKHFGGFAEAVREQVQAHAILE
jgi:ABC-type amino acid transport substrate-binding protein